MIEGQKQQDIKNKHLEGEIVFQKSNYTNLDKKVKSLVDERSKNLKKIEDYRKEVEATKRKWRI